MGGFVQDQRGLPGGIQVEAIKTGAVKKGNAPRRRPLNPVTLNGDYSLFAEITKGGESIQVLPNSPRRSALIIQNKGVNPVFINFGSKSNDNSLEIPPGGEFSPTIAPINAIYLFSNTSGESVTITEARS